MQRLTVNDFEEIFSILKSSLPPDEYRTKENQLKLFNDPRYRVYGRKSQGTLVAFIAVWELSDYIFIEHFAVKEELRGLGIGSEMILELKKLYQKPFCLEVELPINESNCRRIAFYRRLGFSLFDYDYTQPAMDAGKSPIPLKIMATALTPSEKEFNLLKNMLYKEIYKII